MFKSPALGLKGLDSLAGVSGYLGYSSMDKTTEEVELLSAPLPISPGGAVGGKLREKAFFPAGLHLQGLRLQAPLHSLPRFGF